MQVYTARHDPSRCFDETLPGGAFGVRVRGAWLPRHVLGGRCHALCAALRCAWLALCVAFELAGALDAVLCDQVAAMLPVLRVLLALRSVPAVFYCHFPDLLLASHGTLARRLYRAPMDCLEEVSTGCASAVLVNSEFTASVFNRTFGGLRRAGVRPRVLYPAVDLEVHAPPTSSAKKAEVERHLPEGVLGGDDAARGGGSSGGGGGVDRTAPALLVSLNRFERKKGLGVAIEALAELGRRRGQQGLHDVRLCLAGGYDPALQENVEHLDELKALAKAAGVAHAVTFVPNFSAMQRRALLSRCVAVVYTPQDEHFGIVPLEAMAAARPVVACASGGPRETVVDSRTGYLCEPTAAAFADALERLLDEPAAARAMGAAARAHVAAKFSKHEFGRRLEEELELARRRR